jgi:FtsH-binding integral membrane protein
MWAFGNFTKRDLTIWSSLILMILVGIGLNIWVNMVWRNDLFQLITTGIFMAVFVGLVVYDTNRIKEMCISRNNINPTASLGAFALYLDLYYLLISIFFEANKESRKING